MSASESAFIVQGKHELYNLYSSGYSLLATDVHNFHEAREYGCSLEAPCCIIWQSSVLSLNRLLEVKVLGKTHEDHCALQDHCAQVAVEVKNSLQSSTNTAQLNSSNPKPIEKDTRATTQLATKPMSKPRRMSSRTQSPSAHLSRIASTGDDRARFQGKNQDDTHG